MKTEENIALIKQQLSDFKIDLGSIKELLDVKRYYRQEIVG